LQIVFWESTEAVKAAQEMHKASAGMFGEWSDHANAMHQILVWSALELEGVGANLQHMNAMPPVEAALKTFLGVPAEYKLKAHLNYGDEAVPHPDVPQKLALGETFKVVR
jgi:predicted oxidoreductase (fatty acid repression mutant protein)